MQRNETTATSTVLLNGEQAKSQLEILEAKAKSLRKSIREAADVGDLAGLKKYNKELSGTQREMKQVRSEAFNAKKVLDNLSGSSMKELQQAQKKIDGLLKNGSVSRRSKEWYELVDAQKLVKKEMKNVNAEMGIGEKRTSKLANGMNKYFSMLTAGVAAITGVVFSVKQIIQSNAELSDSFADVMKTTNLTQQQVQDLYKDFKSLDTRTSRKELLQLASDAGKLGIEGKKNILDFVDAANQIKVALGEELGEDAIKNIGKMVGVFSKTSKELQGLGLKEQMLAVGSAVNSIGQNSSASEEFLVAFAARLGGVSKQAGIGIDQILGYASALDQDMQQVEMSATALQNFIMKIMGDPAKFAKIAGLEVNNFTKLLDTDANAAIKKVLRSLNEKGGFQALIPIFEDMGLDGSRAVGVLSSLAASIDKIDKEQLLANKSLSEGTSITKEYNIRNNNLAASLAKLNQNISTWFKNSALTSWLGGIVSGLEKMTSASKTASQEFEEQSKKVLNLKLKIEPLLTRYDELNSKTTISTSEHRELKKIIAEVTGIMPNATTAVDKYGNALSISTSKVREFINAEVARLGVINKKAIYDNQELLNSVEKQLIFHKKKIDEINKTGTFVIRTVTDRKSGETYDIKANVQEIKAEQEKYRKLLQDKIGYTAEIDRLSGATLKKQMEDAAKDQKLLDEKATKEKAYYTMSKAELKKLIAANDELAKQVYNDRFKKETKPPGTKPTKNELYEEELKLLEDARKDEELVNKTAYANESVNEEVFHEWQYQAKMDFLAKKLELDKKYKKDTTDTEAEIADSIISENEYWNNKIIQEAEKLKKDEKNNNKDIENETKEHLERIAKIRDEFGLNTLRLTYSQQLQLLKEKLAKEKASEEETALAISDFRKRIAADYINDSAVVAGKASEALNNLVEMQTIAVETKYAKEIEVAEKAGRDTTALQEKSEKEKKEIKKKYALIDFLITNSRIVAETAAAVMKAAPNIPLQIAEGILGVTQLGIAMAEYNSVKNLWTGGFTEPGNKYKPAGIVHAGEFVANQEAVGNNTLRRLFNVVDYAQKTNTVAHIDNNTIARALQMKQGFSSGGFTGSPADSRTQGESALDISAIASTMRETNAVNAALLAELQKGISAKVAIRGSNGIEEVTQLYDKLMTNVTKK